MKIRLALFVVIIAVLIGCENEKVTNDIDSNVPNVKRFAIVLNDYSSIRFQPQLNSSRIDSLMKGTSVQVVEQSAEKSTIAKKEEYWYKIEMPSGVTGWTFGTNLKILKEGDDFSIDDYKKQVASEKMLRTVKLLTGKWWSVTRSGNFTSHSLILYEDQKYRSARGGGVKKGTYTLDMDKNLILFSDGATFGDDLTMVIRGQEILIEKDTEKYKYRFKKISSETEDEKKPETFDPKAE